jgi:hypothetical protein
MFYELQPQEQRENYKKMLAIMGSLTQLFSESASPYLAYRAHENIFCKYFEAENLARLDCSADAKKNQIGVGLKTWTGKDDQKIAEFGKLRETFQELKGKSLVKKIAEYRNERIRVTKNLLGIDGMVYHVVKRVPGAMQILECVFEPIDIANISVIPKRGNVNNTYFTDGKHTYHFSKSKNTLYMLFDDMVMLDNFSVEIIDDPYLSLVGLMPDICADSIAEQTTYPETYETKENQICLRLYSVKADGTKFIAEKSGLNQWNAAGRKRDPNEVYIPYPAKDREKTKGFFPDRLTVFNLRLPDGKVMQAKICQQDNKAIMSNPNKELGKWLLRNVFELPEGTLVTYEMLERFGIDSVIFTKHGELEYSVDFAEIGTYERFHEVE